MKVLFMFLLLCAFCFGLVACAVDAPTGAHNDEAQLKTASADSHEPGGGTHDPPPAPSKKTSVHRLNRDK